MVAVYCAVLPFAVFAQASSSALPTIHVTGFAQLQYTDENGAPGEFLIYRVRAGVAGKATESLSYNLIIGAVEPPDRQPHLVNAYVDYAAVPGTLKLRAGQFLVPFGLEGPEVITFNPAIERSTVSRRLNPYNIFRDAGLQAFGESNRLRYAVAVINGSGANNREDNGRKNVLGRVAYAVTEGLVVGVSADTGAYTTGGNTLDRDRLGLDVEYLRKGLQLRGEFITRSDAQAGGGDKESRGWYLLAAKRLNDRWEPVLRYEQLDPNRQTAGDRLAITTLGVNYYLAGRTRFSVNYEFRDDKSNPAVGNLLTTQMQVAF